MGTVIGTLVVSSSNDDEFTAGESYTVSIYSSKEIRLAGATLLHKPATTDEVAQVQSMVNHEPVDDDNSSTTVTPTESTPVEAEPEPAPVQAEAEAEPADSSSSVTYANEGPDSQGPEPVTVQNDSSTSVTYQNPDDAPLATEATPS
jgi:hypothetical protein